MSDENEKPSAKLSAAPPHPSTGIASFERAPDDTRERLWLGRTNYWVGDKAAHGCVAVEFESARDMNSYFTVHPLHMIVTDPIAIPDGHIFCLVSKRFTPEEQEEFDVHSEAVNLFVEQHKQAKEVAKNAAETARIKAEIEARKVKDEAQKELQELAELGRKCRANHKKEKKK